MKTKLRVFDFDETLVKTDSTITVKHSLSRSTTVLKPEEFATYQALEGDIFDFSSFAQVSNPQAKRHDIVLKGMLDKADSDVVVLTARADNAQPALVQYIRNTYKGGDRVTVITLGSSDPYDKAMWIRNAIKERNYTDLYFCDDSWENCRAVGDVCHKLGLNKMKIQKL